MANEPTPAMVIHGQPRFWDFFALADPTTTSLVKSGRGFFHALTVTGGTAGTVILYDNTEASGTIVASFSLEGISFGGEGGTAKAETYPDLDLVFQTGLVVSTTAVDSPRVTISYK